ncbi:hypothetical protein AAG747_16080 [Rapidithrix thailandica]|uniref:Knr4/Smi1-like domain-containing protein n=1 Tax=Rapidithrix thailandica TaxID=413964 RepID=A0AAW9S7F9_9BACT
MKTDIQATAQKLLGRPLLPEEGIPLTTIEETEKSLAVSFPETIKNFYRLVGNISLFTKGFERFVPLEQLQVQENKVVFLEENQSVMYWAFDIHQPGRVFQTTHLHAGKPIEWSEGILGTDKFLQMLMYYQCVMGDEYEHQATQGGFSFFASLSIEEYRNARKAQDFIAQVNTTWECIVKADGIAIFWKKDTILSYFLNRDGEVDGMLLACTKNEAILEQLVEDYGFGEL